jgi:hemolysin activation/secretion protein
MTDPEVKAFKGHSASWTQPLPWRHILTIFGSYVNTDADVAPPFALKGFDSQLSARYEIPLPQWRDGFQNSVIAGIDYKRANNNLAFGGTQVFGGIVDTAQADLIYSASAKDPLGSTTFRGTYVYSPGGIGGDDHDAEYQQARAGAIARYNYGKIEVNRVTGLPYDFSFVNLVTLQLSDSNLLASEQLGFGGYDTIRGYDMRVVNADQGYIISTELRTPSFGALSQSKRWSGIGDKLQALGFVDYGCGWDRDLLAGEASNTKLLSAGPGVRYSIAPWLSARFDYGWQLFNPTGTRPYASRSDIGITASF